MEVGAAVDRGVTDRLAAQGVGAVTPGQGLVALERLLEEDRIQTAVFRSIGIVMWKSRDTPACQRFLPTSSAPTTDTSTHAEYRAHRKSA